MKDHSKNEKRRTNQELLLTVPQDLEQQRDSEEETLLQHQRPTFLEAMETEGKQKHLLI